MDPPVLRGRPPLPENAPYKRKNCIYCSYGECKVSKARASQRDETGVFLVPFPKPCLTFRQNKEPAHDATKCFECSKALRWLKSCCRADGKFNDLSHIKKNKYICSLHFVGRQGPTATNPDPIPATASSLTLNAIEGRTSADRIVAEGNNLSTINPGITNFLIKLEVEEEYISDDENENATTSEDIAQPSNSDLAALLLKSCNQYVLLKDECISILKRRDQKQPEMLITISSSEELTVSVNGEPLNEHPFVTQARDILPEMLRNANKTDSFVDLLNKWSPCEGISGYVEEFMHQEECNTANGYLSNGHVYSSLCKKLVLDQKPRCPPCVEYMTTLQKIKKRKLLNKSKPVTVNTNNRFLPRKQLLEKLESMSVEIRKLKRKTGRKQEKKIRKQGHDLLESDNAALKESLTRSPLEVCRVKLEIHDEI